MKEMFIKINIDDDNKLGEIEMTGNIIDLSFIALIAIRTISEKTGKSIEHIVDEIKETMIQCDELAKNLNGEEIRKIYRNG